MPLEAQLDPDSETYASSLTTLSTVYADRLNDQGRAFERALLALSSASTRIDLLHPTQTYATRAGRLEEFYEECCYLLDLVGDEQLAYLRVVADVGASQLGRLEDSLQYFERLLELDPADVSAVNELCAIYEKLGRWDELQQAYERLSSLLRALHERRNYLHLLRI